jgi:hypothetical protein
MTQSVDTVRLTAAEPSQKTAENVQKIAQSTVSLTPRFNAGPAPVPAQTQTVSTVSKVEPTTHHRRWGRIPRLPAKARLYINQSLRDGATYGEILEQLANDGHTHISYENLVNWYRTGFVDWLRDQEHFEKLVLTTDGTSAQTTPPPTRRKKFRTLSELDFTVLLNNAAREFNLEKLRDQIAAEPNTFFRLVQANAMHERNAILRDRNEIELKKMARKKKAEQRAAMPKRGGVTHEEMERIERRINL